MKCLRILLLLSFVLIISFSVSAVNSQLHRHKIAEDFDAGETENVIVSSEGTIQLSRYSQVLVEDLKDVWAMNTVVAVKDAIYFGTSPNGGVFKYQKDKITKIYSAPVQDSNAVDPNDPNAPVPEKHLANEHIFAMCKTEKDQLLIGISGDKARLCVVKNEELKTLFKPDDAKYIFALVADESDNVYIATGPEGIIYKYSLKKETFEKLFETTDKNVLCLALTDDALYAGTDTRGLVYRIDPKTGQNSVLYDSDLPEITALFATEDSLFAAGTAAKMTAGEKEFAARQAKAGRRKPNSSNRKSIANSKELQIANAKEEKEEPKDEKRPKRSRMPSVEQVSMVYEISKEGFVKHYFQDLTLLLAMEQYADQLVLGTGNDGKVVFVEEDGEVYKIAYEDKVSAQITALDAVGDVLYVGMANPPRLLKLTSDYSQQGMFESGLIDASQPASWGTLQIEANIAEKTKVEISARTGNVDDVNDESFSEWSKAYVADGPVQLDVPNGRFCQYKLVLKSKDGSQTPIVREVALASRVPNLKPDVQAVEASLVDTNKKPGMMKIQYQASDQNGDKLVYRLEFKKIDWTNWIELKDRTQDNHFEWDSRTVEDSRYEIRVTASDELDNTPKTKLTDSRVSDPFVVDNTSPQIEKYSIDKTGKDIEVRLTVVDEFTIIGKVAYTIDSDSEWNGAVCDDGVCDTTREKFTLLLDDLEKGEHILSVKIADDLGNTMYRNFKIQAD